MASSSQDAPNHYAGASITFSSASLSPTVDVGSCSVCADQPAASATSAASNAHSQTDDAEELECLVCFDTLPRRMTAPLCARGHRYCDECSWRCCQSAFNDGLVPACPMEKEHKCGSVSKDAAERALSRWLSQPGQTQRRKAELKTWAIRGSVAGGFTSGKVDEVYLSSQRAAQGAVQCIGRNCGAYYVPPVPHSQQPQRLVCTRPKCEASFCAACRQPYHFRSTCAEALRINVRWVRFLQTELTDFLVAAVKVDPDQYGAALKEHTKAKGALDEATRDALSRFDELRKMEQWKEKHCRHCPKCHRVVEKLSGCDQMVCGTDTDTGGNQQRGCGKRFSWQQAPVYQADLRSAAEDGEGGARSIERRLQLDARELHLLCEGSPVCCDGCGAAVVGPRLQCVQCAGSVDLCVRCVGRAVRSDRFCLRDGTRHRKDHVFRRIRQVSSGHASVSTIDLGAPVDPIAASSGSSRYAAASSLIALAAPSVSSSEPRSLHKRRRSEGAGGGFTDASGYSVEKAVDLTGGESNGTRDRGGGARDRAMWASDNRVDLAGEADEGRCRMGGGKASGRPGDFAGPVRAVELLDSEDSEAEDELRQAIRASRAADHLPVSHTRWGGLEDGVASQPIALCEDSSAGSSLGMSSEAGAPTTMRRNPHASAGTTQPGSQEVLLIE